MEKLLEQGRDITLSLLRIVTAFLYMQHGGQKLVGYPKPMLHEFELLTLNGFSGVLELAGGFLVLMGLFTRSTAFILSGHMAFAYFLAHAPRDFWPINNGGESAIMFCFSFLYLAAAGGGKWSLDYLKSRRSY